METVELQQKDSLSLSINMYIYIYRPVQEKNNSPRQAVETIHCTHGINLSDRLFALLHVIKRLL